MDQSLDISTIAISVIINSNIETIIHYIDIEIVVQQINCFQILQLPIFYKQQLIATGKQLNRLLSIERKSEVPCNEFIHTIALRRS